MTLDNLKSVLLKQKNSNMIVNRFSWHHLRHKVLCSSGQPVWEPLSNKQWTTTTTTSTSTTAPLHKSKVSVCFTSTAVLCRQWQPPSLHNGYRTCWNEGKEMLSNEQQCFQQLARLHTSSLEETTFYFHFICLSHDSKTLRLLVAQTSIERERENELKRKEFEWEKRWVRGTCISKVKQVRVVSGKWRDADAHLISALPWQHSFRRGRQILEQEKASDTDLLMCIVCSECVYCTGRHIPLSALVSRTLFIHTFCNVMHCCLPIGKVLQQMGSLSRGRCSCRCSLRCGLVTLKVHTVLLLASQATRRDSERVRQSKVRAQECAECTWRFKWMADQRLKWESVRKLTLTTGSVLTTSAPFAPLTRTLTHSDVFGPSWLL